MMYDYQDFLMQVKHILGYRLYINFYKMNEVMVVNLHDSLCFYIDMFNINYFLEHYNFVYLNFNDKIVILLMFLISNSC
jgi:hypothetical protein